MSEHLQHLAVVAEHVGFELRDPVCVGDKAQMFEQQSADAAALELVENCECDLCAMRIGAANVTADADEAFAAILSDGRGQTDVTPEVELGQMLQIVRRQIALGPHETKIDGLFAQPHEMLVQAFLIVEANRADPDRDAVEHFGIDAIFLRVAEHVAIS